MVKALPFFIFIFIYVLLGFGSVGISLILHYQQLDFAQVLHLDSIL